MCKPFFVGDKQIGLIQPAVYEAIRRHPEVFLVDPSNGNIWLHPALKTYEERSQKIDSVLCRWRDAGLFNTLKGWRDEVFIINSIVIFSKHKFMVLWHFCVKCYEVRGGFAEPSLMKMERAATCKHSTTRIPTSQMDDLCSFIYSLMSTSISSRSFRDPPVRSGYQRLHEYPARGHLSVAAASFAYETDLAWNVGQYGSRWFVCWPLGYGHRLERNGRRSFHSSSSAGSTQISRICFVSGHSQYKTVKQRLIS